MNVTRECISRILELREILLSIQTGFRLVNAAVVCAILASISCFESPSVITEPRYLKPVNVRRRTLLLYKETEMHKWAGMLVETGKVFVDPSAMVTQMSEDSDFWSLPALTTLC